MLTETGNEAYKKAFHANEGKYVEVTTPDGGLTHVHQHNLKQALSLGYGRHARAPSMIVLELPWPRKLSGPGKHRFRADVVTTTTHKTLRGPRGGLILARPNDELHRKFSSLIFPGTQGGPLMHVIAAKAVSFLEALQPGFRQYQQQVLANARAMAATLQSRGYRIVSGGTENHLFLVDLIGREFTGKDADAALGRAHITVNKNAVPNDPRPPFVTSGLRVGTPAITTRGFREAESRQVGDWIADVLGDGRRDALRMTRLGVQAE